METDWKSVIAGMPTIELLTPIAAPIDRVFDLARSIDLHTASTSKSRERAIAGVTSGLIGLDEEVTWKARHFGIWQTLSVRITNFERPNRFADTMLQGVFRRLHHRHIFEVSGGRTLMRDVFDYESPLGILGQFADVFFLEVYMRSLLKTRNAMIKAVAESDDWRRFLRVA